MGGAAGRGRVATSPAPALPRLVLVSGKPGAGKSTLARRLAGEDALWLPLVSRDAIKHGLAATRGAADAAGMSAATAASLGLFYGTIERLLREGVSLIAEESFRRGLDERHIRPLLPLARTVNIHRHIPAAGAHRRFVARQRARQAAGGAGAIVAEMARGTFDWGVFDPLDLDVPTRRVETTRGHAPALDAIIAFAF